jgi:hypothetical protein
MQVSSAMQYQIVGYSHDRRSILALLGHIPSAEMCLYHDSRADVPLSIERLSNQTDLIALDPQRCPNAAIVRLTSPVEMRWADGNLYTRANTPPPPPVAYSPVARILRYEVIDRDADEGWSIVELGETMNAGDKLLLSSTAFHDFIDFEHIKNRRYRLAHYVAGGATFMRYPIGCSSNPAPAAYPVS